MKNIATVFKKAVRRSIAAPAIVWPLSEQLMGLEIEVESTTATVHPENIFPYWTKTRDGSLRNGCEYVLTSPQRGNSLSAAIHEIFLGSTFERTTTGSTHIHVDMMEETTTINTIKNLVMLIYVLEPAIFAIADRGREWCGYTNKLASAPDDLLINVFNNTDDDHAGLNRLCENAYGTGRYYGLNLLALHKYGSVEFRYFPTATSADELVSWVQLVQSFKKAATEIRDTAQLYEMLNDPQNYEAFIATYFADFAKVFMHEVPQYIAAASMRKALAVASLSPRGNQTEPEFNPKAITDSVLLSKYAPNKPEEGADVIVVPIIITRQHESAEYARNFPEGAVLIHSQRVYVGSGGNWIPYPYSDIYNGVASLEAVRAATAAIQRQLARGGFTQLLGMRGWGPSAIASANVRIAEGYSMLSQLFGSREGGVTPPPAAIPGNNYRVSLADMISSFTPVSDDDDEADDAQSEDDYEGDDE